MKVQNTTNGQSATTGLSTLRQHLAEQYDIDSNGVIRSPGKFEGEMLYVPYFWDAYLDGCADGDDGKVLKFNVTPEDRQHFPELKTGKRRTIKLIEDDQGFVREIR